MSFLENNKKVFLVLFIIYFVTNIPLLINFNGIYWDDWVLFGNSIDTLNRMFFEAVGYAGYSASYMHYYMINSLGIYSYRILTFALLFLSGYFVFKILYTIPIFSSKDRFFITLFFLIAPLYDAKIAIINFPYTLYSTLFFFAFYILSVAFNDLKLSKRISILVLFFISFLLNALLVFYAIVLVYIFYKSYNRQVCFLNSVIYCIKNNFDFILLPIVFFAIKYTLFVPTGLYANYNSIDLSLALNLKQYYLVFIDSFYMPILVSLVGLPCFILIVLFISIFNLNISQTDRYKYGGIYLYLLVLGFMIFFSGSFAYIVVSKPPAIYNWASRFQALLPLGFSFILYYGLKILSSILKLKIFIEYFLISILIVAFSIYSFRVQYGYNIDWLYQQGIMENFAHSPIVLENDTFAVAVNLGNKLAQKRILNFYELNGLSRRVLGSDNKLYFAYYDKYAFENYKMFLGHKQYNYSSWNKSDIINIRIDDNIDNGFNGGLKKSLLFFLKLRYLEIMDIKRFKAEIRKLLILDYDKL